ncbi:MAG: DUF4198 domain-containing protein [Proteobacteria bacterium]|nr:DUF4198 domain-containing protein [Pseudomonadota bacterium]
MSRRHLLPVVIPCIAIVLWFGERLLHAHQQWVMPNFFVSESDGNSVWLGFEHTLGDRRFVPSVGPGPAMLWVTGPDDEHTAPSFVSTGKTRTLAEIELTRPGTYRITAEEPEAYWTKIKDGDERRWLRLPRDRVVGKTIEVSKRYWAKAITYVTFRQQTTGPLAAQGDPLELVPIDHPSAIRAGKPFRLQVLAKGQSLSGQEIKVYDEAGHGHDATMTLLSRADGKAQLRLTKPGRYLLSVRREVPASGDPGADAYSYSVYLMIEVQPRTRRGKG